MRTRVINFAACALIIPSILILLLGRRTPILILGAGVAVLAVAAVATRRSAQPDPSWRGPTLAAGEAVTRPERGSPVVALASVESRELVFNPAFAIGASISLLIIVFFGWFGVQDDQGPWDGPWEAFYDNLIFGVHPQLAFIALATHFSMTRSRRHGCDELFDACPMDRGRRTAGHLGTAVTGAVVALGFAAIMIAAVVSGDHTLYGPSGPSLVPSLLTLAVLGAGAVAVGAATGRWLRFPIAPVIAVVAILALNESFSGAEHWEPRRYLASAVTEHQIDVLFVEPRAWGRVAWLGSIALLIALVALVRDRRKTWPAIAGVIVVAAASFAFVSRPMSSDRAAAAADLVVRPLDHQRCIDVEGLSVCSYDRYPEVADRVAAAVRPVVAAAAPHALDGTMFLQFPPSRDRLPVEVVRLLGEPRYDLPPGVHDLTFGTTRSDLAALRLRVAAIAVGAPAEPMGFGTTPLAGQARGVLMLWLGSRGLPLNEALALAPEIDLGGGPTRAGLSWPTTCGRGGPVNWSYEDFSAARSLMHQPDAAVAPVVLAGWTHLIDPATTTDELLAALGLPLVGPPDPSIGVAGYSCD